MFAPRKALWCARRRIPLPPMGPDAPSPAREKGLQPYGARYCFGWRSEGGAGGRAESHPACIMGNNFAAGNSLLARIGTGRPKGRSHFSFGGERKVCKRKPAARRLREKALYCPFWRRGSLCRAQHSWIAITSYRARSCSLFSSFKKGKAFSLRCLSPLCSGAVGGGHTYPLQVGMLRCGINIFALQQASVSLISRWPF